MDKQTDTTAVTDSYTLLPPHPEQEFCFEDILAAGRACRDAGNFEEALKHFETALLAAKISGDLQVESDALNLQAGVIGTLGDYPLALEKLEQALVLVKNLRLDDRQANILNNIGTLHTVLGNYPQALESLKTAHKLLRASAPGSRSAASNLIGLGTVYQELGDRNEARSFFAQAVGVAREAKEPLMAAAALNNLANADMELMNWSSAAEYFQQALGLAQHVGAKEYEIDNLDGLGQVYVALGDHEKALQMHQTALEAAREIGHREGECDALLSLGKGYLAVAQHARAAEVLEQGLAVAEASHWRPSIYKAHELLSQTYAHLGDYARAFHHHREFHNVEKAIFNEENERQARKLAVQFDLERARHETEEYRLRSEITQRAREEAEARVRERTRELEESQLEIVTRLAVAGEYRDDNTGEHTKRVGRNAAAIAHALGWSDTEVQLLFTASRLHDVGKIGVSDTILHKPGKLEPDEMSLMRTHAVIGARILSSGHSRLLQLAEEIALAHHERWDGKGYPYGLAGDAIPLSARIVAVADVLDALTHTRPYKRPWSVDEALAEINRQSGYHFDPRVVEACFLAFGPGSKLSPRDVPEGWNNTAQSIQNVPLVPNPEVRSEEGFKNPVERLEKLLAAKTQELETSRREAQMASQRLQELAFTDPLTGLHNRRAFEADLEAEAARALHQGDHLTVLNLDLDRLKWVNDTEGHERGDELLRIFARALSDKLQEWGRLYRVGGDEFAAILAHTTVEHIPAIRVQISKAVLEVQSLGFPSASVSVGIVAFPDEASAPGDLVRLGDQRMYDDKLRGRQTRQERTSTRANHTF